MQRNDLSNSSIDELYSQQLTVGIPVFVISLSVVAILTVTLNATFLIAVFKKKLLKTPSSLLLGVLCCNDLLTGLIALPLYAAGVSQLRSWLMLGDHVWPWGSVFIYVFQGFSIYILALISLDRYAAVCHPYKYIHHATLKLYSQILICIAIIYLTTIAAASIFSTGNSGLFRYIYGNMNTILFSAISIICSWKIYNVIQHKINDATSITIQDMAKARGSHRERKRAYMIFLLVSVHFICYLPFYISSHLIYNNPSMFSSTAELTFVKRWSYFPFCLSSIFNPLIYYFRMSSCRAAIKEVIGCS